MQEETITLGTITEDTNVRGSPQTRGYIHQSLLSCKNNSQKDGYKLQQLRCHTLSDSSVAIQTFGLYFKENPSHRVFLYSDCIVFK